MTKARKTVSFAEFEFSLDKNGVEEFEPLKSKEKSSNGDNKSPIIFNETDLKLRVDISRLAAKSAVAKAKLVNDELYPQPEKIVENSEIYAPPKMSSAAKASLEEDDDSLTISSATETTSTAEMTNLSESDHTPQPTTSILSQIFSVFCCRDNRAVVAQEDELDKKNHNPRNIIKSR